MEVRTNSKAGVGVGQMSGGGLVLGVRAEVETRVIGKQQIFRKHTRSWKPKMLGEKESRGRTLGRKRLRDRFWITRINSVSRAGGRIIRTAAQERLIQG